MNSEKLKEVLESHKHWLNEDCDGWEKMRADLSEADLRGANLRGVNLREANLSGVDLRGADLSGANLGWVNLSGADLCRAILFMANLSRADLGRTDLRGAFLRGADLDGANLRGTDFREACLFGANLFGADLEGADLSRADLGGAILCGAKNVPFIPFACPDTGTFIGFKKASLYFPDEVMSQEVIVELAIVSDARRSSATGRECRCDKAKVLSITTLDGVAVGADAGTVRSDYDHQFVYKVGEIVTEPNFCEDRWKNNASGIYFFINRQEAVEFGKH